MIVSAGVLLVVFLHAFMQGVMGDVVASNAKFDTGHVKIVTRAYEELSDQNPNDLAIIGVDDLLTNLQETEGDMIWSPRIRFGGLLDIPDETGETKSQGPVMGLAMDLLGENSKEIEILGLENAVIEGRLPEKDNEILISKEFAEKLNTGIGETATLLSSTMYGSMAIYNFRISGLVRFGITALDRSAIIVDIRSAKKALDMSDAAGEILGFSPGMLYEDAAMVALAEGFNSNVKNPEDEFSPVMRSLSQQNGLGDYVNLGVTFGNVIIFIFMFAMSIVLWNSGLMNGIRRYGEVGVRLAMGEPKRSLYFHMIAESVAIGVIGSFIGTALGLAISYYLQVKGIDFSSMTQKSTMLLTNVMRARVTPVSYLIGLIPGVFASVIGTMFAGVGIYRRQTSQLFKELEV
jgi:putative ABC transport system permease protein